METFKKRASPRRGGPRKARQASRSLVSGCATRRGEEQDHVEMGPARNPARHRARPTKETGLPVRSHLPGTRCRCRLRVAVCGQTGHAAAPRRDERGDQRRKSAAVDPAARALVVLDQAGRHMSAQRAIPDNITPLPLQPRAPALNPVENVWQVMRGNGLSNRVLASDEDIVDHCCEACNERTDRPWRIMSSGRREWAHGFWSMSARVGPVNSTGATRS